MYRKLAAVGRCPINVVAGESYWWCACGRSKTQPFCDGSHKGTAFRPQEWKAEANEEVLGGGQQKWGFLPNAHTDFIFSVIGEELGFIGAIAVLLLLGSFVWFGIRAATRSADRFGGLLAIGLVAWLASETLINIGAVIGVLPVTGIPLPFISFGGSSLVITMAAAGILINIARQEKSPAKSLAKSAQPHGTIALPRRGSERMTVGSTSGRGRGR